MNDGAAMLVLASADYAEKKGLEPIARFVDWAVAGVEPERMGYGPVPAIRKLLERESCAFQSIRAVEPSLEDVFVSMLSGEPKDPA